jgi:hypothetical protein
MRYERPSRRRECLSPIQARSGVDDVDRDSDNIGDVPSGESPRGHVRLAAAQRGDSVELVHDCLGFGDCGAAEQIAEAQYLQGRAVQKLVSGWLATAHGHTPEYRCVGVKVALAQPCTVVLGQLALACPTKCRHQVREPRSDRAIRL